MPVRFGQSAKAQHVPSHILFCREAHMNTRERVLIFALDGCAGRIELSNRLDSLLEEGRNGKPNPIRALLAMVKCNDTVHLPNGGRAVLESIVQHVRSFFDRDARPPRIGIMLDLKLADVSATNVNILSQYAGIPLSIVTVSGVVSCQSLTAIRSLLPNTMIALVNALTDIPEDEFVESYGMLPVEWITRRLRFYERRLGRKNPIGAFVSSPLEVRALRETFGNRYRAIVPGVRSPFMANDHQERIASPRQAILDGAHYLVMGTQLSKGNPQAGISPEKSRLMTSQEIVEALAEMATK